MKKKRAIRLAGFVSAVGVSAALVAAASSGTGAYFTDSHAGSLQGTSGQLVTTVGGQNINFTGLNPGQDKSQNISFSVNSNSTTNADIWLVFDTSSAGYGAFTGAKTTDTSAYGGVTGGGMGQYGHFAVTSPAGNFDSYNLQLPSVSDALGGYTSSTAANTCTVDAAGHGGSNVQHTVGQGYDIAECGVPGAIELATNLAPGQGGSATIIFGLTGKQTAMNQANDPSVGFHIVATQPGISPTAATW